jgi:hypothetical protein
MRAGVLVTVGGDAQEDYIVPDVRTSGISFMDFLSTGDTDTITENWPTTGHIHFTGSADPATDHAIEYSVLQLACRPNYDIVAAGKHTATGVDNPQVIAAAAVQAGDIVHVQFGSVNTGPRTMASAIAGAGNITVALSGAPTVGDKINYVALRPRGGFKPSHYIAYAGLATSVADAGAPFENTIAIAGNEAINVPIVQYNSSDDTDTIVLTASNADNIVVTMSADPGVVHILAYMLLKAYS